MFFVQSSALAGGVSARRNWHLLLGFVTEGQSYEFNLNGRILFFLQSAIEISEGVGHWNCDSTCAGRCGQFR